MQNTPGKCGKPKIFNGQKFSKSLNRYKRQNSKVCPFEFFFLNNAKFGYNHQNKYVYFVYLAVQLNVLRQLYTPNVAIFSNKEGPGRIGQCNYFTWDRKLYTRLL